VPGPAFKLSETAVGYPSQPGIWQTSPLVQFEMDGTQVTESDSNQWPPPKKGSMSDYGSEFFTQKKEVLPNKLAYSKILSHSISGWPPALVTFEGNLVANCFNVHTTTNQQGIPDIPLMFNWPPDMSSSRHDLEVKGTVAVSACSPGNSIAQAASFVGELLQDVPRVPGIALWESRLRAIETIAASGDEFLNAVFGILPTVGDMGTFLKAVHKVDHTVDQFIRDSGRLVRRSFHYPKEMSVTTTTLPQTFSPVGQIFVSPGPNTKNFFAQFSGPGLPCRETIRTRTIERETWFDGAFTYHLPSGYDAHSPSDRRKLMAELFGAKPDLNTLWQLTPWSWAVDWFSDAQSTIKNWQNHIQYGTVMRYGYVMEKTTVTDTFTAGGQVQSVPYNPGFLPHGSPPSISPISLRVTTKKRIKANPFGFGLSWDGLSTVQKAILGALGITRVVK
jgi:hypothetical protein